ncbi:hypothetical protein [Roseicyclus mahoneyensis]|nr:hypothetical protein [Roseicyclus mahoneyensis]
MESILIEASTPTTTNAEFAADRDIQLWLKMGRAAFFFCLWSSMAIPVALIYYARF